MLQKHTMSEGELESWFNSYFSFSSVERAKTDLDRQKQVTFGHRLKDFEHDVNSWRGIARNRILAVHTPVPPMAPRMAGNPMDFVTDDDFNFVNSYFDKFPDLFYANEDDADEAQNGGHYQQMRDIVAAIVRRRVPALAIGNRRRFGSALRRVVSRISNPHLRSMMSRYHNIDDAGLIAMVIMSQNEAKGSIFYADKNPFEKKEGKMQRFSKLISRTEVGRSAVKDAISKPLNTFLRLSEGAVRMGAKVTNKVVSKTGRATSWAGAGLLGGINRAIE